MSHRVLPYVLLILLASSVRSHSHNDEPPHLKYTKEVNEAVKEQASSHGHSHEHHGHSHEDHGCAHEHVHSHEHAHAEDSRHHSHEEHGHSHHAESHTKSSSKKVDPRATYLYDKNGMFAFLNDPQTQLWVHSIGATLLISIFPFLILSVIPIQANTDENSSLLKVLLALGAGGLIGDAFLHLIPHASMGGDHSHSHSHSHSHGGDEEHGHSHDMFVGGWVITGFLVFFVVEKFMRIIRGEDGHGHSHGHSHHRSKPTKKPKSSDNETDDERSESDGSKARSRRGSKVQREPREEEHDDHSDTHLLHHESSRSGVAWLLNLVADMMHNFTDGLAIGASFIAGTSVGVGTMVMVLVHEIPHEIGDFAILVQSGFSKKKAMLMQLLTALGALGGCMVSLWSVDPYGLSEAAQSSWVLPFTAGGFIYIATVSIIPELLEKTTFWQSVVEVIFICVGIFMMYLIALYE